MLSTYLGLQMYHVVDVPYTYILHPILLTNLYLLWVLVIPAGTSTSFAYLLGNLFSEYIWSTYGVSDIGI
ncbi:hypothetical protein TI04_10875 [Achromatium sp. WMS2]|nr:hypothetical protein TI04_10875 [Achromatium sp. WMS2]